MRRWFSLSVALIGVCILATLQVAGEPPLNRMFIQPVLPSNEALARIGLKRAWCANVGTLGRRDGLFSVQAVDGQILTQTFGGSFTALDADTGAQQWQIRLGEAYPDHQQPVAANQHYCFLYSDLKLTGVDRRSGLREWALELPLPMATAASADEVFLYLTTSDNKVRSYFLPLTRQLQGEADQMAVDTMLSRRGLSTQKFGASTPKEIWSFDVNGGMAEPPAAFGSHIVLGAMSGSVLCFENGRRNMTDTFRTGGAIAAPIAQYGDMALIASQDHHLYAVELVGGRMEPRWQFTAGSRIVQKPMAIGNDVFVAGILDGMYRLDRVSGQLHWNQPRARRFLAVTPRLVIAVDDQKQLLVLDRQRGHVLGTMDASSFTLLPGNVSSDRAYLAGHNGLVVCLRDIDPSCDRPLRYETKLSSAMESAAKEFRATKQAIATQKADDKTKADKGDSEGGEKKEPAPPKKDDKKPAKKNEMKEPEKKDNMKEDQ